MQPDSSFKDSVWSRYGIAVLATLAMAGIRIFLSPYLETKAPFTVYFFAVAVAAYWGGLGPGIFASFLAAAIVVLFNPLFSLMDSADQIQLGLFLVVAVLISVLCKLLHRAKRRSDENARAIEAEERKYRNLLTSKASIVFTANAEGAFIAEQPSWEAYTGQSWKDCCGWGWLEAVHIDDRESIRERWKNAYSQRPIFEYRGRVWNAAAQEYRYFVAHAIPVLLADGKVQEWMGSITDVQENVATQEDLRRSEKILNDFFENGNIGMHCVGPDGTILRANQAELSLLGYSREEYVGKNITDFHVDPEVIADILTRLKNHETLSNYEAKMRAKDGSIHHVLINSNVLWENDQFIHTRCFTRDVTKLKLAQKELSKSLEREKLARNEAEQAGRMKDEFLATMSHELRTPLNAILGWIYLLREGKLNPSDVSQGLDIIERSARSQLEIISDLMDMSRIVTGTLRLDIQKVDPAAVLNTAIETVRFAAKSKNIQLESYSDPQVEFLMVDPTRFQQIIWNLLSNAIKFTPERGKIEIRIEGKDSWVELRVTDSGNGIGPDFLPFVFDRFRQENSSTTRKYGGLGLGLAIVKTLVELHGGTVIAESEGAGKGSTFIVMIPRTIAGLASTQELTPQRQAPVAQLKEDLGVLKNKKVLVVDDEPLCSDLVKRFLERHKAKIFVANSVEEAMKLFEKHRPDLIVSDLAMPDADGYEFMRKVRELSLDSKTTTVPAIALSALTRPQDRNKALASGYQAHLLKPVDSAELVTTALRLLQDQNESERTKTVSPRKRNSAGEKIRVLCVDDHSAITRLVQIYVDAEPEMQCVGRLHEATHLLEELARQLPDVLVLDFMIMGPNPLEVLATICSSFPEMKVIIYSGIDDPEMVETTFKLGVKGYLSKENEVDKLIHAIRRVVRGEQVFPANRFTD